NGALIALQGYVQTLAPWDVVVPFARELARAIAETANASRILRDFQRLLSLVKAVAIIRHRHRERNTAGRWVATIDDYRAVYDLVGPMFEASISGNTEAIRKVVTAVAELSKGGTHTERVQSAPITYAAVARKIGMHPEQAKRTAQTAIKHEWLFNDEDKPNKPARLRVGEPMPETVGLPTPEAVETAFTGLSHPSHDVHIENPDEHETFTPSQPDRRARRGHVIDGDDLSPPSANGHGDAGEVLSSTTSRRSAHESMKPVPDEVRL
ncbi:MAG: hypothetical protein ACJ8FV_00070, partial [Xanthobacteraceae bacterium]